MMKRTLVAGAMLTFALCVLAPLNAAPGDDAKSKGADDVANIALAQNLADYGRQAKSPEMLIAAARILRTTFSAPGTEKPKVEGGTDEGGKPTPLSEQAKDLLKEAKEMAPNDKLIGDWADRVANMESKRGSFGGPKSYYHRPGAGVTITWNVNFIGGQPASVSVTGNGKNVLTLHITAANGHNAITSGRNPSLTWIPNANRLFTITVTNDGPGGAAYTLYHN